MTNPKNEFQVSSEAAHICQFLGDLNARIARLAIGLHIALDTEADIQQAIHALADASAPALERRSGVERRTTERVAASPERRTYQQRSELRGMLVMRYEAEVKLVDLLGGAMSRQVLGTVARRMESLGFLPGAGGSTFNRET